MRKTFGIITFAVIMILSGCSKTTYNDTIDAEIMNFDDMTTDTVDSNDTKTTDEDNKKEQENISNVKEEIVPEKEIMTYKILAVFDKYENQVFFSHDIKDINTTYEIKVINTDDNNLDNILSFFQSNDIVEIIVDLNDATLHNIKLIEMNEDSAIVDTEDGQEILNEETRISVTINDAVIVYDVVPQNIDGYVMLPLRYTIREFGFVVRWHEEEQSIDCIKDNMFIRMEVGKNAYHYNNEEPVRLKEAPVVKDGRTMVPIEFFTIFLTKIMNE